MSEVKQRYWAGMVPRVDDFGVTITDEFVDGKSRQGPWGFFTPASWAVHGVGRLGVGYGQRYQLDAALGRFVKVEG